MKQGSFSWWKQVLRWGVCLLAISVLAGRSAPARADVAPLDPPYGTNPQPGSETTNVRMMAETVLMDVHTDALAYVTASFTMRNLGETEERMEVGFPLDQAFAWGSLCHGLQPFKPITDLKAWVDGYQVETQTDFQTVQYMSADEIITETVWVTATVPCWERFTVTFPPQQDVDIQITYTGEPYDDYKSPSYGYSYILFTGAGWKDTIGSADITIRMPYVINKYNYRLCGPNSCTVIDNEVHWHFEDFEPGDGGPGLIYADFVPLPEWLTILDERNNTANNPNDGEAWGRLGKAYKNTLGGYRGYYLDEGGIEIFQWSMDAYQKALALLPNDADWHFGYAELICTKMEWNSEVIRPEEVNWVTCLEHLHRALQINPSHERTLSFLQWGIPSSLVDLSGDQPVFLGLTKTPSPIPTMRPPIPTLTPTITRTRAPTSTPTITPTRLPTVTWPRNPTVAGSQLPKATRTQFPTKTTEPTIVTRTSTYRSDLPVIPRVIPTSATPPLSATIPSTSATPVEVAANVLPPATLTRPAISLKTEAAGAAAPAVKGSRNAPVNLFLGIGAALLALVVVAVLVREARGGEELEHERRERGRKTRKGDEREVWKPHADGVLCPV